MSTALFVIFISTYSYYFYKNQRQTVIYKALNNDEKNTKVALERFRSSHGKYDLIRREHERMAKKMAREKLNALLVAINAESDPIPLPKVKVKEKEVDPADVFIEETAPILKAEPLLKPISKSELEKPFIDIFNKIVSINQNDVDLRRFTKGMEQLVDMSYILVDKQKITFFKGDQEFEWEVRAYAIPYQTEKDSIVEKIKLLENDHEIDLKKITIFRDGQTEPLHKGLASKIDYEEVQSFFDKANKTGKPLFVSARPYESYQLNNGQEELQVRLSLYAVDPTMGLCIASTTPIFKSEWMQFSFLERNWQPILAFIVLAWIICPILGWVAFRMASQFKFKYTVDLEGDEGDFNTPKSLRYSEPVPKRPSEGFMTQEICAPEPEEEGDADETKTGKAGSKDLPKTSFKDLAKQKAEPTKIEPIKAGVESLHLESQEVHQIRQNNIRKSTGEFNRHQDDEQETDYLAGVQSDVLKSLIKKLRED
jgi:hypothetical protein